MEQPSKRPEPIPGLPTRDEIAKHGHRWRLFFDNGRSYEAEVAESRGPGTSVLWATPPCKESTGGYAPAPPMQCECCPHDAKPVGHLPIGEDLPPPGSRRV